MTQPSAVIGARRIALLMSISMLAAACAKNEQHSSDSGGTVASVEALAAQRATLPGLLAKPLDQYTGEEFFALTRAMRFTGGNDRTRRCRGRAECGGRNASQSTHVRVDAVERQDSVDAKRIPGNGVIAIRAYNRGSIADSMYAMRPTARFEYYLIVLPAATPGQRAVWKLEELDVAQGIRAHRTVAHGTVTECNHPFVRGARADFKSCATAAQTRPASFSAFQGDGPEDPLWFGCTSGCCTAELDGRS